MNAAIYARKSTDQFGLADEKKSVTRQIEHARKFAASKGWQVRDEHIYVDDGISGAEFSGRPGFVRLMNALKPKAPFDALVMSEESRLGREAIETAYALKQLITAGVRVWFYLEERERKLESPTDKLMLSVTAYADELEREKARQRTYDAMARKARAGHVTGGRVFGYDNVEILSDPDAQGRTHRVRVERRINESEAVVVRRIFELCAAGHGYSRIAKMLNAERVPCPRPQQSRPSGWATSSVHEILKRPLYHGEIIWNQTRKRDHWGQHKQHARPAAEWMRIPAPELRIVDESVWLSVQARLAAIRARLQAASGGKLGIRQRDFDSHYLLPGFARCGVCGGGMGVMSRSHGSKRVHFYGCVANHKRGSAVCENGLEQRMDTVDRALLDVIAEEVLSPKIIEAVIAGVFDALMDNETDHNHEALAAELVTVDREIARLTQAIVAGGEIPPLVRALQERQARRTDLLIAREPSKSQDLPTRRETERRIRAALEDWRGLLIRNVQDARNLLRRILLCPLRLTPVSGAYRFEGEASFGHLFGEAGLATLMASPTGFEPVF